MECETSENLVLNIFRLLVQLLEAKVVQPPRECSLTHGSSGFNILYGGDLQDLFDDPKHKYKHQQKNEILARKTTVKPMPETCSAYRKLAHHDSNRNYGNYKVKHFC